MHMNKQCNFLLSSKKNNFSLPINWGVESFTWEQTTWKELTNIPRHNGPDCRLKDIYPDCETLIAT